MPHGDEFPLDSSQPRRVVGLRIPARDVPGIEAVNGQRKILAEGLDEVA